MPMIYNTESISFNANNTQCNCTR